jgi:Zn-dependent protease with chaperone function
LRGRRWLFSGLRVLWDDGARGMVRRGDVRLVLVPIAALMSVSGRIVSRHRELAADRAAAVLTGSPPGGRRPGERRRGLSRKTRKDLRAVAGRDPLLPAPGREATRPAAAVGDPSARWRGASPGSSAWSGRCRRLTR